MATFVVAHGAWSAGFVWKKMHPLLAAKGPEAEFLPMLAPPWRDLLWLAAVPAAAALIATVTARLAVGRFLARAA